MSSDDKKLSYQSKEWEQRMEKVPWTMREENWYFGVCEMI